MQRQQKNRNVDYSQMLNECENNSRTYEHLHEKVRMTNQQIISKVNGKKVQQYCSRKFDTKQKEMINQICSQMREKLEGLLERETSNLLTKWRANGNLKVVDYIRERKIVMEKIGENSQNWYDEDEHHLDQIRAFLSDYYKKM